MIINVFLPCKRISRRVPNKNKKRFASNKYGLFQIKINQLLNSKKINSIVLSTNDRQLISYTKLLEKKKIIVHEREDKNLSNDNGTVEDLIDHAMKIMPRGHILWTHVTSPFVSSKIYDKIILEYIKAIKSGKYDSLMTVSKISGYVWNNKRALSYDSKIEKWPKTQNIKPLNKVNSAVFLSSIDNYKKFKDRIGKRPLMHSLEHPLSFDIDNIDDFRFAETVFKKNKNIYFK